MGGRAGAVCVLARRSIAGMTVWMAEGTVLTRHDRPQSSSIIVVVAVMTMFSRLLNESIIDGINLSGGLGMCIICS